MIPRLRKLVSPCKDNSSQLSINSSQSSEDDSPASGVIDVIRPAQKQCSFDKHYLYGQYHGFSPIEEVKTVFRKNCKFGKDCVKKQVYNRVPAIKWLKNYRFRECLLPDIMAGLTVGIMRIPEGMGYALLATLPPIYGLYTSFFPVLIYWIFGTSKHLSFGTFAVAALLVGNTVTSLQDKYAPPNPNSTQLLATTIPPLPPTTTTTTSSTQYLSDDYNKAKVLIAMAQCFWVGVIHCIMFVFQLGFITSYLTEPFINSFIAASAIHVFTSQIKFVFGLKMTAYVGSFKIIKTYIELFSSLQNVNIAALIISIISITILAVIRIQINERFQRKMPLPFPTELFIVIFGTLISYYTNLPDKYQISVIGKITPGIPKPEIPPLFLIKDMALDCVVLAMIAYTINYSLADIFSRKHFYKIDPTQELFASGASNIFGSFFLCFTGGGSLARSSLQESVGGKTQLVSVFSSILLLVVLTAISPLFESLPQACLASIIIVSLKNLLLKVRELAFYWKTNKIEFMQFLVTYIGVVVFDIDIGLLIGLGYYFLVNLVRQTIPNSAILGNIPGTEIYKDIKLYRTAREYDGIKVIRIEESLHNTNAIVFKKKIYEFTNTKPQEYINRKQKLERALKRIENKNKPLVLKIVPESIQKCCPNYFTRFKRTDDAKKVENLGQVNMNFQVSTIDRAKKKLEKQYSESKTVFTNISDKSNQENEYPEYEQHEYRIGIQEEPDTESQQDDDDDRSSPSFNETTIQYDQTPDKKISLILPLQIDNQDDDDDDGCVSSDEDNEYSVLPKPPIHHIVLDCSSLNYIDTVGVRTLEELIQDYTEIGVQLFLAECNDSIIDRFHQMQQAKKQAESIILKMIFLTVHDAVISARSSKQ